MHIPQKLQRGFTMVELMVTVSIAAILFAVAVPSFTAMMASTRITTQANEMVAAINFSRSEAIKRNANVTLCRATGETDTTCSGSAGTWQNWIVRNAAGAVVRRGVVNIYGGKVIVRSTLTNDTVVFSSDGLARTNGAIIASNNIDVCATNITQSNFRRVTMGSTSRISTTKQTLSPCS